MEKLIFALALMMALAAPAWAYEQIIFTGTPRVVVLEDGTELHAIELSNGKGLYKLDPLRGKAGEYGDYLAGAWEDLPEGFYKAVMEIEHATTDGAGNPITERLKLADAEAQGVSYTEADVLPPHNWQGWE